MTLPLHSFPHFILLSIGTLPKEAFVPFTNYYCNYLNVICPQFTKEQADKLGVRGWCMNTSRGTVQGQLQGSEDNVQSMYVYLPLSYK